MGFSDFFEAIFILAIALPMAFSARVMELTEKIASVRDKVAGFLGIEDWYY